MSSKQIHIPKGRYSHLHLSNHVKTRRLRKKYGRPYRHSTCVRTSDCSRLMDMYTDFANKLQRIAKLVQELEIR
jgi:hypothetical protein